MPKDYLLSIAQRLCRALAIVVVAVVPLAMFVASVMTFYNPEVIAVLLLRTAEGYLELFGLFVTSMLPVLSGIMVPRARERRRSAFVNIILAGIITGIYTVSSSLLYYRIEAGVAFDFSILWYHFEDGVRTLRVLGGEHALAVTICLALIACHYYGLLIILSRKHARRSIGFLGQRIQPITNTIRIGCLVAFIASQWFSLNGIKNLVLESSRGASQARSLYNKYFTDSIRRNQQGPRSLARDLSSPNLFIVQLESINANLVTPSITPNLLAVAKESGVLFPKIQAPSVFTVLSMETILCGTLPTLETNLAQMNSLHDRLTCLPRMFREKGFKTLYFQAYPNLQFNNMERFFRSIGFDEAHAQDIMKPGDPSIKWGFVEDVFYRRVFEYLEKFRDQRIFAYIVPGSANHYPFYDREIENMFASNRNRLPYQAPRTIKERMANTMFIQDYFFGEMFRKLYSVRFGDASHMFVLGDHSWPAEAHIGNRNNLKGAFQENFVTTMAFLPRKALHGPRSKSGGRIVHRLYGYLDLPATVMDLYGVEPHQLYGKSFLAELDSESAGYPGKTYSCILSVQPFSGGQIAVINYPKKYILDLKNDSVAVYDLETDPQESNAIETVKTDASHIAHLELCLRDLIAGEVTSQGSN